MNRLLFLIIAYILIILSLYPVIEFEYHRYTKEYEEVSAFSYWFRIFFSGPFLIIIGGLLVWKATKFHKIIGLLSLIVGIYWIIKVTSDIVSEIRIF